MAFVDTPTRVFVELDTQGHPVGRFQHEVHRTLEEDPGYVRVVVTDIDAAAFDAIWDNANIKLSGDVQALSAQIAQMQATLAEKDRLLAAKDALISQYTGLESAWNAQIVPALAQYREAMGE